MRLRQKAVKGLRWLIFQNLGAKLVSFLVLLVLARLLEPSAFGLVALAVTAISFLQTFVAGGFAAAIIQRSDIEQGHLDTAFWINVMMSLIAISVLWFFSGSIAAKFGEPELEMILLWSSPLLLIRSMNQVQIAVLHRNLKFKSLAIRELGAVPIGGVVGVAMAFSGYGVWSLVGRELATSISRFIILWLTIRWKPGFNVSWQHFRDLFSFGASMLGFNLAEFFHKRSADLLIGYFLGAAPLGYYTIASRIFRMLTKAIAGTLGAVVWPVFSRMQDNIQRLRNAFYFGTSATCLIVWPIFVGLSAMAPDLVPFVFGKQWIPSIPVMQILAFLGLLRSIFMLNGSVIMALGKPHWRLYMQIFITVTSIAGFYFVYESGIVYVAIWYVFAAYLFLPVSLWMVNRLIGISVTSYFNAHGGPMIAAIAMAAFIFAMRLPLAEYFGVAGRTFFLGLGGALIYILIVRLISPGAVAEFSRIVHELASGRRAVKGNAS